MKDLEKHFKLVPGEANPLWDIIHSVEAKCDCPLDDDNKSHGIVHPTEAFERWWHKYHG